MTIHVPIRAPDARVRQAFRSRIGTAVRRRPLAWFFALAFLLAWACWLPLALTHRVVDIGVRPTHFPGLLGPLLAALAVTSITEGRHGIAGLLARMGRWRVAVRWYLAALSPLAFFACAVLLVRAGGGDVPDVADLGKFGGLPQTSALGVWFLLTTLNGFGEEAGWRGYAIPRFQRAHGPLASSLLLTAVWAAWHVPLFFVIRSYRNLGIAVLPGFFFGLACGAVILTWLVNRSGSILMVALWHGSYNLVSGTVAARGMVAAVVTVLVIVQATVLVALHVRARRAGQPSPLGPPPASVAPLGGSRR